MLSMSLITVLLLLPLLVALSQACELWLRALLDARACPSMYVLQWHGTPIAHNVASRLGVLVICDLCPQIKFIKIDTEAHELYVLKGGAKLFTEAPPPMVLMEFYPR